MINWHSSFLRECETPWSKLQKFAWFHEMTPAQALGWIVRTEPIEAPISTCMEVNPSYKAWRDAQELFIAGDAGGDDSADRAAVLATFLPSVREQRFEFFSDRKFFPCLRYCLSCLQEGSHLIVHQLLCLDACLIHGEYLIETCPRCKRTIENWLPSKGAAYSCPHCRKPLCMMSPCDDGDEGDVLARVAPCPADWEDTLQCTVDPILYWMEGLVRPRHFVTRTTPWVPVWGRRGVSLLPAFVAMSAPSWDGDHMPIPKGYEASGFLGLPIVTSCMRRGNFTPLDKESFDVASREVFAHLEQRYVIGKSCRLAATVALMQTIGPRQSLPSVDVCYFALALDLFTRRAALIRTHVLRSLEESRMSKRIFSTEAVWFTLLSCFYFSVDRIGAYQQLIAEQRGVEAMQLANDYLFHWGEEPWLNIRSELRQGVFCLSDDLWYGPSVLVVRKECSCGRKMAR